MLSALTTLALFQGRGTSPALDAVVNQLGREERFDALLDLDGDWDLPFFVSPFLGGFGVAHQFFVVDPAAAFGLSATNALRVIYG
jgi:hypothetical protein